MSLSEDLRIEMAWISGSFWHSFDVICFVSEVWLFPPFIAIIVMGEVWMVIEFHPVVRGPVIFAR